MPLPKLKYLVVPGFIRSTRDEQYHYITARELMALYKVDPRACEIYEPATWWSPHQRRMKEERNERLGLIRLNPRDDGNYTLPE